MNKPNIVRENFKSFQKGIICSTIILIFFVAVILHFGFKQAEIGLYHVDLAFILLFASVLNLSEIHSSFEGRVKAIANKNTKHPFYGKYWLFNLSFMHIVFGMIALVMAEIISVVLVFCFNFVLGDLFYNKFNFILSDFASAALGYFILFGFMFKIITEIPIQLKQFNQNSYNNKEA